VKSLIFDSDSIPTLQVFLISYFDSELFKLPVSETNVVTSKSQFTPKVYTELERRGTGSECYLAELDLPIFYYKRIRFSLCNVQHLSSLFH